MKTKTFTVGIFVLLIAAIFATQLWHLLVAIFPSIVESKAGNMSLPIIGVKIKYILESVFHALLTFVGIQLTKTGLLGGE